MNPQNTIILDGGVSRCIVCGATYPLPEMTHEEKLKELRGNPQVGDSWKYDDLLRTIVALNPLVVDPQTATREKSVVDYLLSIDIEGGLAHINNIKLVPRLTPLPKPEGRHYTTPIIDDPIIPTETPCQIAQRITTADRRNVYGHPADDFQRIADMWSAYLGVKITAEQVGMCQILVKVGRMAHTQGHWDSICDIAGYSNCLGIILQRAKEVK